MHPKLRLLGLFGLVALVVTAAAALFRNPPGPPMTMAAQAFLNALTPEQRAQAIKEFTDEARLDWHFIPKPERKGLQIKEMTQPQRVKAHALLSAALSDVGYGKATTIMELESILHALEKDRPGAPVRDPERYYFTIFGQPDAAGKWGLSVEGHHLSLNFVVSKNRVVSHTPAFFGANPATVRSDLGVGPKRGTRVLKDEEALGFELVNSLDRSQLRLALIADQAPPDLRAAGEPHPPQVAPEGIAADDLTAEQLSVLRQLIEAYLQNMPEEIAQRRLAEIEQADFDNIHFAWAGALEPGIGHYYRVQGPSFLIEFVNTQPDSEGNPANHIHSVWRDMTGDFGIDIDEHGEEQSGQ
jgi:hypothetical protein